MKRGLLQHYTSRLLNFLSRIHISAPNNVCSNVSLFPLAEGSSYVLQTENVDSFVYIGTLSSAAWRTISTSLLLNIRHTLSI